MAERPSHGVDATDQRSPPARTDDAP
jgi:hypothetical protein